MDDLDSLLALAVPVARQAGALLLEGRDRRRDGITTKTSDTDMVSDMDRACEELIVEGLRSARPDDAIVGEEGAEQAGASGVRWVIDPLDGTTNYLYGHPAFAVSIAAEIGDRAVVGVVADPAHDEVFTAVRGGGAFLNGARVAASDHDDLATALVATGFSYVANRRRRQAAVLTRVLPAVRDIRRNGAASLDLCWVGCGRLDGYYESGLQRWDVAAGLLVAAEAGAATSDFGGGAASAESVVAAAPALAAPLRRLVADADGGSGAS